MGQQSSFQKVWKIPLLKNSKIFSKQLIWFFLGGKYRADLNATTMLGQSKTAIQAEIDAAAEMVDFFRFNAFFGKELLKYQPISEDPNTTLNLMR